MFTANAAIIWMAADFHASPPLSLKLEIFLKFILSIEE